jgi:hypothetical protein
MERVSAARALFMYVAPEVFLKALLGGAMSDIIAGAERRLARLHRRLGENQWRLADLSSGECVAMTWLSEMTALNAAAERFSFRVLWLDFDQFLAAAETGLAMVLEHFGAGDSVDQARHILDGPTMRQYAKEPAQRFDAAYRRLLLDRAGRDHGGEVVKGLRWLEVATKVGPTVQILVRRGIEQRAITC